MYVLVLAAREAVRLCVEALMLTVARVVAVSASVVVMESLQEQSLCNLEAILQVRAHPFLYNPAQLEAASLCAEVDHSVEEDVCC